MAITVRLFGILAVLARERVISLHLPQRSTLRDVVEALDRRFGRKFAERILRVPGELHSYCALFVNGTQVDDLDMELSAERDPAEIAVILFMASEGG